MITEKDLRRAIEDCYSVKNPNAGTCEKLAAYYTILDHMDSGYSYSQAESKQVDTIRTDGNSEFAMAVDGIGVERLIAVMEELMDTLKIINPRIHSGVMRRLKER